MCDLFGGGSDSNDDQIEYQKKQEEIARKKEEERVKRLNAALDKINKAFHGTPATHVTENTFDWNKAFNASKAKSGGAVAGLPAGYTYVQTVTPGTPGRSGGTPQRASQSPRGTPAPTVVAPKNLDPKNPYAPTSGAAKRWDIEHGFAKAPTPEPKGYTGGRDHSPSNPNPTYVSNTRDHWSAAANDKPQEVMQQSNSRDHGGGSENQDWRNGGNNNQGGTPATTTWQIRGPDGKLYDVGDDLVYNTGTEAAASGGFDKTFYDKYREGMLGFYQPEVARQFGDANKELTFRLARAGTLKSQAANDTASDLVRQNVENRAMVSDKADTAVGELKTNIASMENTARSLVNAAEDPTVEANTQLSQLGQAKVGLAQPDLTPLGEIFKVAMIGGGNALSGYSAGKSGQAYDAMGRRINGGGYGSSTVVR